MPVKHYYVKLHITEIRFKIILQKGIMKKEWLHMKTEFIIRPFWKLKIDLNLALRGCCWCITWFNKITKTHKTK